ncbi:MAG TPA: ornithine acetyltransferase, partial [Syntrophomonas wolfei]|nr:ornithine acetyltransferase [Syntrophomonas wolfei]
MKIINGSVCAPRGFLAQGAEAGIKKIDKKEVAIIYSTEPCTAAGVFTSNKVRAACIDYNKACLADGTARAIVANSGNANSCSPVQALALPL